MIDLTNRALKLMKINGDKIDDIYNQKKKVIIFEFVLENFLSNS